MPDLIDAILILPLTSKVVDGVVEHEPYLFGASAKWGQIDHDGSWIKIRAKIERVELDKIPTAYIVETYPPLPTARVMKDTV